MTSDVGSTTPKTLYTTRTLVWIMMTLILTPLTAGILAEAGYIPFDTQMAVLDGFIVAIVYVGFRIFNAERRARLARSMVVEEEM